MGKRRDTKELPQTGTGGYTKYIAQTGTGEFYTKTTLDWDCGGICKVYIRLGQRRYTQGLPQTGTAEGCTKTGTAEGYTRTTSDWTGEGHTKTTSDWDSETTSDWDTRTTSDWDRKKEEVREPWRRDLVFMALLTRNRFHFFRITL